MKRVILRVDDVHAATRPADLLQVYGGCWERGVPVCLAVIPQFARSDSEFEVPADVREGVELLGLLREQHRAGLIEVALHGWQHRYAELAKGSIAEIRARLQSGLAVLRAALPEVPVRVLVPPHDYLSRAGLQAASQLGLGVCSTWAATHGGTRMAHWWGRARRWRGLPFAPARPGLWPTDVTLLDFDGPAEDDWPTTQRLLELAGRWDSPVVLAQHYGRLLAEGGASDARAARWQRWMDRMADCPDVRFERFTQRAAERAP
jgi:hypothetical protein